MKTVAILGISNLIIPYGYGQEIKKRLGDDCLLRGLGTSPSLTAAYWLLTEKILDKYEFVILDYNIIDSKYLVDGYIHRESLISWLLFIIRLFQNSHSTLVFLILPNFLVEPSLSASYIYRALGRIFNIEVLDLEWRFKTTDDEELAPITEANHFYPEIQSAIADSIMDILGAHEKKFLNSRLAIDISLSYQGADTLKQSRVVEHKGTSLINRDVIKFTVDDAISLPDDLYLCGIFYWCDRMAPYMVLKSPSLYLSKNLNINLEGFFCRPIANLCLGGVRGGKFYLAHNVMGSVFEPDNCEPYAPTSGQGNWLYINALLFTNKNPYFYGRNFYKRFKELFDYEKNCLALLQMENFPFSRLFRNLVPCSSNPHHPLNGGGGGKSPNLINPQRISSLERAT